MDPGQIEESRFLPQRSSSPLWRARENFWFIGSSKSFVRDRGVGGWWEVPWGEDHQLFDPDLNPCSSSASAFPCYCPSCSRAAAHGWVHRGWPQCCRNQQRNCSLCSQPLMEPYTPRTHILSRPNRPLRSCICWARSLRSWGARWYPRICFQAKCWSIYLEVAVQYLLLVNVLHRKQDLAEIVLYLRHAQLTLLVLLQQVEKQLSSGTVL